jgi:hypothetical protein
MGIWPTVRPTGADCGTARNYCLLDSESERTPGLGGRFHDLEPVHKDPKIRIVGSSSPLVRYTAAGARPGVHGTLAWPIKQYTYLASKEAAIGS